MTENTGNAPEKACKPGCESLADFRPARSEKDNTGVDLRFRAQPGGYSNAPSVHKPRGRGLSVEELREYSVFKNGFPGPCSTGPANPERPNIALSGVEYSRCAGPIVYMLQRRGRALYVGMSTQGLVRPLDPNHGALADVGPDDSVLLWFFDTAARARAFELLLIEHHQPERNKADNPRYSKRPRSLRDRVERSALMVRSRAPRAINSPRGE